MADDIETLARVIFGGTSLSNGRSLEAAKAVLAAGYVSPARHDADIAAAKAAGAAEVIARVAPAVEAWNIEVARLSRVRAKAEAMVSDYTHAEAGHVRMAGRTILHILDTPVPELRAALTTGGEEHE